MRNVSKAAVFLACVLATSVACGPEEAPIEPAREPLDGNYGEVLFTYAQQLTARAEPEEPSFQVSARFVRVRDIGQRDVRTLWGGGAPDTGLPRGECEQSADDAATPHQVLLDGSVDLLDAGELTLRTDEDAEPIPNWSFPSVYGVVAGVLYGRGDLSLSFAPGRAYRVVSNGSAALGAFEVVVVAPDVFEAVAIGEVEAGVEPVVLDASQPIELRWEPGQGTDEVVIEISYSLFGGEQRITCRSHDDGLEELPRELVAPLWAPGVGDARLTFYRVARVAFGAEGLDEAEAVFVVSATVPLAP
jgi:hypothetical protein